MEISISKNSEVPLRWQLAEQIVIAIATGELRAGERMPSVRALARRVGIHHNTVSEAYQDLVRRKWLTRKPGSRLVVGERMESGRRPAASLDDLIDETIERARERGFSLQALRKRVRERLLAQAPDHVLVVAEEAGLRLLIREEVRRKFGVTVEVCSPEEFAADPGRAVGAQVFAPGHILNGLGARFCDSDYVLEGADEQARLIRGLKKPSIVAAVSVSESLLARARGCLRQRWGGGIHIGTFWWRGRGGWIWLVWIWRFAIRWRLGGWIAGGRFTYLLVSGACLKQV